MVTYTEHTVKYTSNGSKQIHYLAAGPQDGPLLIFIHGWPGIASTWKPQMDAFSALGFRVAAPDMPGYGQSTVTKVAEDYSHEIIIPGLFAMLSDLERSEAVWIGHDWGAGVVSSLAATRPELCRAVCLMSVPYRILELGKEELIKYSSHEIYPRDQFPYAQWSYMEFYETNFEKATKFFDQDSGAIIKLLSQVGSPTGYQQPAITANVVKDGGWFGGIEAPMKEWHDVPFSNSIWAASGHPELQDELIDAMTRNGWWSADAYYSNHARNRKFNLEKSVNGGVLEFPFLFVAAVWDQVCETKNSRLAEPMRRHCKRLTECQIEAGHWVSLEKPEETNAAMVRWLVEECKDYWPGYWRNGFVKTPTGE
jgi:soluble epoxide hydrolase / lipid-phosphate phosphatase